MLRPLLLLLCFPLLACSSAGPAALPKASPGPKAEPPLFSTKPATRHLVVLHTSDGESDLLGEEEAGPTGGIARAVALVRALARRAKEPVLVVAAGDTFMPAPELRLELDGQNPVRLGNALMGYRASALGNHEFDLGDAYLADSIAEAGFPYLSATLSFEGGPLAKLRGEAGAWLGQSPGRILPSGRACLGELKVEENGASRCEGLIVGVVGATTETLRTISNASEDVRIASSLEKVRARVQAEVDRLTRDGVDIIVLLSHLQGVQKEIQLVEEGLVGVDVIVAGGGDDRLADPDDRLLPGDSPAPICRRTQGSCYPLVLRAKDGAPVLVVATDGQHRYVGELAVSFDDEGRLVSFDAARSRPWPVDEVSLLELRAPPAKDALALEARVRDALAPLSQPFAESRFFLEGRREAVRNRQTNLGDLSADSILWAARTHPPEGAPPALFGLRNGGGIRAPIGEIDRETFEERGGPLRPLDLESALKFDGPLVVVTTTHAGLKETFESALRGAGTGRGGFPQVSREVFLEYAKEAPEQTLRFEGDEIRGVACPGARVRTLVITLPDGTRRSIVEDGRILEPDRKITFATLAYLAKGGDGWFPGRTAELDARTIADEAGPITEQRALRGYIEALEARGAWRRGEAYADPVPGRPETFTRIREGTTAVEPQASCRAEEALSSR